VAPALALAEPAAARHQHLNERSRANGLTGRHHLRTTARDATAFPLRDALDMPLSPFMHNVRVQAPPKAVAWNEMLGVIRAT
jgi:hypothetical protein